MTNIHDVAAYVLRERGQMTAMKLEKLVYYAKAWHLVWDEQALFPERIEAWANGPVAPDLYRVHKGQFNVATWPKGDPDVLGPSERGSVDAVLRFYGPKPAFELSDMTHSEGPWREARKGVPAGERSDIEISEASMYEYYDGLVGIGEE
ncbi:hypothetical protein B7R21_09825 [Subtercola boreus]|uniref:Antitoxin SocA-like Panacea domain-containing protein n=1 Tax=Subtercola boreus TaxID=120213 RepID=A0A3E0VSM5_9MICO|nr:type II toxin-antitoxin system antitoxin SocA domain-containing protein [Subtercola boreus]RFA12635.1 hypothetical protein B7R21_09825 [Subtercola boreus]